MSIHIDIPSLLANADRRTLAAVVTHLAGDPHAVPDLRDRVTAIIPKRLIDLWQESKAPKLDDYVGA